MAEHIQQPSVLMANMGLAVDMMKALYIGICQMEAL